MSNDILQELEMDLAREKEKIFLQKYKYIILSAIAVILTGVLGYQYIQNQTQQKRQAAADDYYNFKNFYNNIEQVTDVNLQAPTLKPETLQNVPDYLAMSELIRFNNAQKNDAPKKELLKITTDYIKNPYAKKQTIHDSMLRLFNVSLQIDTVDFKTLEPQILDYLKHPFAFKSLGYEMLFLTAIDAKNSDKANHYFKSLSEVAPPDAINKLRVYETHPFISEAKKPVKTSVKK